MSYYRIWRYPFAGKACKHIYFRRDRSVPPDRALSDDERVEEEQQGRLPQHLCRARRTVRDLILCNPMDFFCTFTFNGEKIDRYNFDLCKKKITEVFKNYKSRYSPNFRYIIVPEFHKDGAVHFHGVVAGISPEDLTVPKMIWKRNKKTDALELVPNTRRYVDWSYYSKKLGFFSCSLIRNAEKCAWYVSKYITKDLADLPAGGNIFLSSKNLRRPELVFDSDDVPMTFTPDYQDEFCAISYQSDDATIGPFVPAWYGECCADIYDPLDLPAAEEPFGPRLTGKQLAFCSLLHSP